jgi:hypothetical protein
VHFFTSLALPLVQMDLRIYPFPWGEEQQQKSSIFTEISFL